MKSIKDLLLKKADDIDSSHIQTDLQMVQKELDRYFMGKIKIASFNKGIALVTTTSASVASNMRMMQKQLIDDINSNLKNQIERFIIRIV